MNEKMKLGNWLALLGLSFATFIFNTSEFVPIGLLTDIKNDFGLTEASVGMLISLYAWAVMILSLPLMLLVSKMEMKRLMLWLLGIFTAFQFMSYLSTSFVMLICARIGVACAHAVFWSVISPIAVRIVPDRYRSIALSMVVTGSSIAMILGMPLGRVIGLHVGWRMTFFSIGVFSALTFLYIAWRLPKVPSGGGFSPKKLPELLRHKGIMGLYLFTLLISSAIYVAYSYIEPFLKQVSLMPDDWVTTALMVFGGAGLFGQHRIFEILQPQPQTVYHRKRGCHGAMPFAALPRVVGLFAHHCAACRVGSHCHSLQCGDAKQHDSRHHPRKHPSGNVDFLWHLQLGHWQRSIFRWNHLLRPLHLLHRFSRWSARPYWAGVLGGKVGQQD
ncbi:MAG: MFS transporter [Porphyromonadaceae bacterium]|nr:MAG: MFS transporter [Porphyromonadaceae bacterium]